MVIGGSWGVDVTLVKVRPEVGDERISQRAFSERLRGMRTTTIILSLAVLGLVAATGWQIGSAELANANFQEDIRDMASQAGVHMGVVAPLSDEEMVRAVIHKAGEHGIELDPNQITVQRIGDGEKSTMYLAADYRVPVKLLFFSFKLHFTASSRR
jgi:hypothetical protein